MKKNIPIPPKPTGLGDVIRRATSVLGIKPCAACEKRARYLNEKVPFGRPPAKQDATKKK